MEAKRISNHTVPSSLRTHLRWSAFLCKYCALLLATACSALVPRTPASTNNPLPFPSESLSSEPTLVFTPPTDAPTPEPPDWLIEDESFSISVIWNEDEIRSEDVTLVIPGIDIGFTDGSNPPNFDYLTWSGTRGRLFEIMYNDNLDLRFPIILNLSPVANRYLGFGLGDSLNLVEIYWIDIRIRQVFGYAPPCKSITTVGDDALAIGSEWFAYVCDEDQTKWHAFSLENPSSTTSFQLPFDKSFSEGFEPYWLDSDTLILDRPGSADTRCIVDLMETSEPRISCQEFDLILGRFSPDGNLMEVRASDDRIDALPQDIGLLSIDCLFKSIQCKPDLYTSPFIPNSVSFYLEDSAWLPDSSGILYLQNEEKHVDSVYDPDTRLWVFDLESATFNLIADLDPHTRFGYFFDYPGAIWSPEGDRVLLQNASAIYAYNLTDGTLQLLSDEGGIAIGTVILP